MSSEPPPPWEALQTFQDEPLRMVAYPKEMGNWAEVKKSLTSEQFQSGLTAFEQSAIPEGYEGKKADKDAAVKAFRDAIEAAESGSQDQMKTHVETAITAFSKLQATA